jgi:hypothetical protein
MEPVAAELGLVSSSEWIRTTLKVDFEDMNEWTNKENDDRAANGSVAVRPETENGGPGGSE